MEKWRRKSKYSCSFYREKGWGKKNKILCNLHDKWITKDLFIKRMHNLIPYTLYLNPVPKEWLYFNLNDFNWCLHRRQEKRDNNGYDLIIRYRLKLLILIKFFVWIFNKIIDFACGKWRKLKNISNIIYKYVHITNLVNVRVLL